MIAKDVGCKRDDITEIDGATNTGIDAMREVISRLNYRSMTGRARVIIIDEVHSISKPAWESILKTLEESPSDVYWILCTTQPGKVPKTVWTRCVRFELKPIDDSLLFNLLNTISTHEDINVKDSVIEEIVEAANGSARQAINFLAMCDGVKDTEEIKHLIQNIGESPEAIELCRHMFKIASGNKGTWKAIANLIKEIKDPPETTRIIMLAYMSSVMLGGHAEKAGAALGVLEEFSEPFLEREGRAPLVAACARVWLGDN